MVAIMLFAFAICISASTVYKDANGNILFKFEADENKIITSYEGQFPKADENGNALTWYVTATATENGNTVKTVASVLTTDEAYFTISNGTYSYKGGLITQYNVVSVNFPNDAGITKLNLANSGYRYDNMYTYSPDRTEILFIYLPNTLLSLPERLGQATKILICDIPSNIPVTSISNVMFHKSRSLRSINIPSSVKEICGIDESRGAAFFMCDSLKEVTFGENSQLTTIGNVAFHKSGLEKIKIPDTVTNIGEHAFSYTKLIDSPFTEKSQLTTIGARAFSDIPTLKAFIVPSNITKANIAGDADYGPLANSTVELVTFGNYGKITTLLSSFFGRANIGKIVLPEGPTHIPSRFFICAKIDEVLFPSTVKTAGERVFQSATVKTIRLGANFEYFANSIKDHHSFTHASNGIKEIYISASFYAQKPSTEYQTSYAFACGSSSKVKIFYAGTLEQLEIAIDNFKSGTINYGEKNDAFLKSTKICYADYISNPDNYNDKSYIIYDYNLCDAFYEGKHNENVTAEYKDFMLYGTKTTKCLTCQSSFVESLDPLFASEGFSIPEDGDGGIVIDFKINLQAISQYEEITGKKLKYGVFATLFDKIGVNDAISYDGTATSGTVNADITCRNFTQVDFKLSGFTTDEQKLLKLVMGAYVIEADQNESKISYIQTKKPTEGNKYSYITYNDLL